MATRWRLVRELGGTIMSKITQTFVEGLEPGPRPSVYFDDDVKGFGVRVTPAGHKSYVIEYRLADAPRNASKKRLKIGLCGILPPREARRIAQGKLAEVLAGRDPAGDAKARREECSVDEAVAEFRAIRAKTKKSKTIATEDGLWGNYLLPRLGPKRLSTVTRKDVAALHKWIGIEREKPYAANRAIGLLRTFYNWAEARGDVKGDNPTKTIAFFKEKGRERFLSLPEIDRLSEALRLAETTGIPWQERKEWRKHSVGTENRVSRYHPNTISAIRLLMFTGCRMREVLNLTWREVDPDRGLLWLADSKTGARSVVLSGASLALVQEVRERLAELPSPDDAVFAEVIPPKDENGNRPPAKPRVDLKKPWQQITRHAGLSSLRVHDLRHSLASVAVQSGLSLAMIGGLLGHSNPSTTKRYAHLDTSSLRRAADLVAGAIGAAMSGSRADA